MAPLPPPPPPAPPPPPMAQHSGPPKHTKSDAMDRNALLSQIRGGSKLKKSAIVNDRSSPIIDGKPSSAPSSRGNDSVKTTSNGPSNGPMNLGGLFAGGVPKLRSTGSKLVPNGPSISVNNIVSNNSTNNTKLSSKASDSGIRPVNTTSSIKTSLEEKLQFHQNNNNSFLHSKTNSSNDDNQVINNSNKYHTINLSKAREKANFMSSEGKGQAPRVPNVDNNGIAPSLPKKPSGVQRSNSQSNSRTPINAGRRPGPPNMKPPPPPKLMNGNSSAPQTQPTISSKPSNFNKWQNNDEEEKPNQSDVWNVRRDISSLVSNFNQQGFKPPAPPRNGNVVNGFTQSPTYPPPPPPISTIPSRSNSSAQRLPQVNKIAPNIPIQPSKIQSSIRPPLGPPPPPPHRTTSNASPNTNFSSNSSSSSLYPTPPPPPPSQTKLVTTSLRNGLASGPPPPVRNTSISRDDFASRFATFKAICELPAPAPIVNANKVYPSHLLQSQRRRDPPPPPPQSNGVMANNSPLFNAHNNSNNAKKISSSNPMLHIQIGSSLAQC